MVAPAQAGDMAKALAFQQPHTSLEVFAFYETSYAAQKSLLKSLKIPSKMMKKAAGFQGSSTLQSQDGKQVITLAQWQDVASYHAYTPMTLVNGADAVLSEPARTIVFETAIAQTSIPNATPALRGKEAVVQLVQFTPNTPDVQPQVLAQVEELIPTLLNQQPIPQSVLLLTSTEDNAIALIVNWNCSAGFADVGEPTAIAISPSLAALANHTQQLYNVVNIIPAEPKKDQKQ
ncbi:hypothetical protein ACQ4M4_24410 [Leptolyngbya sp. AN02str]|uniref:hypothetical protein n=1 Tax=Leptolyngbya sp. AN02str TaxID=3423363 RepID=UPI003D313100